MGISLYTGSARSISKGVGFAGRGRLGGKIILDLIEKCK